MQFNTLRWYVYPLRIQVDTPMEVGQEIKEDDYYFVC